VRFCCNPNPLLSFAFPCTEVVHAGRAHGPHALQEVRLSGNPLTADNPGAARYEAIARMGGIAVLNGSEVRRTERQDAELNYLRHVTGARGKGTRVAGRGVCGGGGQWV
jgi:hypothetical protein